MKRNHKRNKNRMTAAMHRQIRQADSEVEMYARLLRRARDVNAVLWTFFIGGFLICSFVSFLFWLGSWQ